MNQFQQKFHLLLELQAATNAKISGPDWRVQAAPHTTIDFAMAAIDELHEFTTSAFQWKWWGTSQKLDPQNALMELVDILHFAISEDLVRSGSGPDDGPVSNRMAVAYKEAEVSYNISMAIKAQGEEAESDSTAFKVVLLKQAVKSMYCCFANPSLAVDWHSFWFALFLIGGDFDSVNKVYLGKSVLNKFRQENGYKLGTYKKSWFQQPQKHETVNSYPKEDNQALMEWLDIQSDYTEESIHAFLTTSYDSLLN